jgi:hypothetical protein
MGELRGYSLARLTPEALSVHRLVQIVQRDRLDEGAERRWAERAVDAVEKASPEVEFKNWPLCERLLPHQEVCAGHVTKHDINSSRAAAMADHTWHIIARRMTAARLLNQTAYYLNERARYGDAETLYRRALRIDKESYGENHPKVVILRLSGMRSSGTPPKYSKART